ncbi:MAG: Bacterial regulatory protein tetR family [Marmoricola sp.]|nr:Bacterial regulatory protein tetR family [Marmoricola sp.]
MCAQKLTEQHGLEGFTMEELAEAAGVSRRTLFNYYPSKIDAVLGDSPKLSDEALERFRTRGAGSNLVGDLRELATELMDAQEFSREDVTRTRRILLTHPRLLSCAHDRFLVVTGQIVDEIRAREGAAFDEQRAQVAVRLLACLFDAALDRFLVDPHDRPLTEAYDDVLHAARQLLA